MDSLYTKCIKTVVNYNISYKKGDINVNCDKSIQIYKLMLEIKREFNDNIKIGYNRMSSIPITRLNVYRYVELISQINNYFEKYNCIAEIYIIDINKPYEYIDCNLINFNQLYNYEDWIFHHISVISKTLIPV